MIDENATWNEKARTTTRLIRAILVMLTFEVLIGVALLCGRHAH